MITTIYESIHPHFSLYAIIIIVLIVVIRIRRVLCADCLVFAALSIFGTNFYLKSAFGFRLARSCSTKSPNNSADLMSALHK